MSCRSAWYPAGTPLYSDHAQLPVGAGSPAKGRGAAPIQPAPGVRSTTSSCSMSRIRSCRVKTQPHPQPLPPRAGWPSTGHGLLRACVPWLACRFHRHSAGAALRGPERLRWGCLGLLRKAEDDRLRSGRRGGRWWSFTASIHYHVNWVAAIREVVDPGILQSRQARKPPAHSRHRLSWKKSTWATTPDRRIIQRRCEA